MVLWAALVLSALPAAHAEEAPRDIDCLDGIAAAIRAMDEAEAPGSKGPLSECFAEGEKVVALAQTRTYLEADQQSLRLHFPDYAIVEKNLESVRAHQKSGVGDLCHPSNETAREDIRKIESIRRAELGVGVYVGDVTNRAFDFEKLFLKQPLSPGKEGSPRCVEARKNAVWIHGLLKEATHACDKAYVARMMPAAMAADRIWSPAFCEPARHCSAQQFKINQYRIQVQRPNAFSQEEGTGEKARKIWKDSQCPGEFSAPVPVHCEIHPWLFGMVQISARFPDGPADFELGRQAEARDLWKQHLCPGEPPRSPR